MYLPTFFIPDSVISVLANLGLAERAGGCGGWICFTPSKVLSRYLVAAIWIIVIFLINLSVVKFTQKRKKR